MTVRPIRIIGDPVLRTACTPVTRFDTALQQLVDDLMDTLTGEPGRAGVAAPQIGVDAQVFVYDADGHRGHLINPTIELSDEIQDDDEGCLSIPGLYFPTRRALHATVHGVDRHGDPLTISGSGFLARALQHETDHLAGRLYVDTLRGDIRRKALREIRAGRFDSPRRHR
ncbi:MULTISPECIES: peptide deformylase [Micromonospora]|uniref:Peptide deformylase n=1 Tax=Micromonospora antibiotica TaxID=2807623 RepID=A0ABS3V3M5_9ACTN|nr:peptide deformylase [Micromonospora antibiotica]MBO4160215.1 peptide deformylase [Micromonospora antibiotica]